MGFQGCFPTLVLSCLAVLVIFGELSGAATLTKKPHPPFAPRRPTGAGAGVVPGGRTARATDPARETKAHHDHDASLRPSSISSARDPRAGKLPRATDENHPLPEQSLSGSCHVLCSLVGFASHRVPGSSFEAPDINDAANAPLAVKIRRVSRADFDRKAKALNDADKPLGCLVEKYVQPPVSTFVQSFAVAKDPPGSSLGDCHRNGGEAYYLAWGSLACRAQADANKRHISETNFNAATVGLHGLSHLIEEEERALQAADMCNQCLVDYKSEKSNKDAAAADKRRFKAYVKVRDALVKHELEIQAHEDRKPRLPLLITPPGQSMLADHDRVNVKHEARKDAWAKSAPADCSAFKKSLLS